MSTGFDHVTPPSCETESSIGAEARMKCGPNTYLIQVTTTLPSPHAVRMGWSCRTPFPWKEPVPEATRAGVLHVSPPSLECETSTSGFDSFPNPRVAR